MFPSHLPLQGPSPPHQALEYVLADFPTAHLPPVLPPTAHGPAAVGQPAPLPPGYPGRCRSEAAATSRQRSQLYSAGPRVLGQGREDEDLLSTFGGVFAMDRGPSQVTKGWKRAYGRGCWAGRGRMRADRAGQARVGETAVWGGGLGSLKKCLDSKVDH